jgi:hypothetical protein
MSVSEEHFKAVCDFSDRIITEKHEFMNRAFTAERRLSLWKAVGISGWLAWALLAIVLVNSTEEDFK